MSVSIKPMWILGARALACALLLGLTSAAAKRPLAFKGAEGAGRYSAGGRGGKILRVTNLNDDGAGSLRAAVEAKFSRIITFDVAGTIRLKSPLVIRHPRITINGQDAPAGGIALADNGLVVSTDDVIIRYIRSRLGDISRVEADAISVERGSRIILDHVSASWSVDETLSVSARYNDANSGIYDVTVQWSIISESLRKSAHAKGDHGYGSLIRGGRGSRFSFHHNLWAHHVARMPRPGNYSPVSADPVGPIIEFQGNIFYNWGGKSAGYNADTNSAATYAFIDNCYISGPDTKGSYIFNEENPNARSWFSGNSIDGAIPKLQRSLVNGLWNPLLTFVHSTGIVTQSAALGCKAVLAHAGASKPRDVVDHRVVADVKNLSGRIIDSQQEVGGWPDLTGKPDD